MLKQTINQSLQTVAWLGDKVVDWCRGGECYSSSGDITQSGKYYIPYTFDSVIRSEDRQYIFLYQKSGTKGLLIKNGENLREINRSYYYAHVYEYPAAFVTFKGRWYLAHCPVSYCQLDFEDVETGEIVTNTKLRKPSDIFHSRLEISKSGNYLMSKGWIWHPVDVINVFKIEDCFANPNELDKLEYDFPDTGSEICTASFINDDKILVGSSDEVMIEENKQNLPGKSFGIWNFHTNTFSNVTTPDFGFGNLFVINETLCWDTYNFPKVINLLTGKLVDKAEDVCSGKQKSSILSGNDNQPQIAFEERRSRLAVKEKDKVIVLTRE